MNKTKKCLIGDKESFPQENIGDLILNALKSEPNHIGQVNAETEECLTFQQMRENSVKCALWLKKVGVKKGDVVTICTRNPSAVYAPFLASIYIGAIVNPWEETYFKDITRVMYFLVINEPDVIFVDHDHFVELVSLIAILKCIKKIIKIVTIGEVTPIKFNSLETILNDDFDKAEIDKFSCETNGIMDIAIKTFSSTALSYPGTVEVPYIAFISPSNKQTPAMFPGQIGLWYGSLCWTHGPLLTIHAILSHVTAIKSTVYSAEHLFKVIDKYKVMWVFIESDMCNRLFQTEIISWSNFDLSTLNMLLFDNWDIKYDVHANLITSLEHVSIIRVYSKPETGVIAYQRDSDLEMHSTGCVSKNVQLAVFNDAEQLGPNRIGMICCKTPYTKACAESKKIQSWHVTQEMGYYDNNGKIIVCDTVLHRRYIKYKNTIVLPKSIENILRLHPAVSEVIVTAVQHHTDGQHPVAYVKTKPGTKVTEKELVEFAEICSFDEQKIRGGVHFIADEIPRLPNGKINRDLFWIKTRQLSTLH